MTTALVDLRWLGLDWDEGPDVGGPSRPYVQSERSSLYEQVLERLKANESVYPCTCTRADIEQAASAPHAEDEGPTYPGTCAHRRVADAESLGDRQFAWRFRVVPGPVAWTTCFSAVSSSTLHDQGVTSSSPATAVGHSYQLAVVADDRAMGVNQVIRGSDLVPSTPRQILLYHRLGWADPDFGHVALALGPDGRRLAKRDGSLKLAALRAGRRRSAPACRFARSFVWMVGRRTSR